MLAVVTKLTVGRKNDEGCGRGGHTLRWCHVENVLAHEDFGGGAVELHDVDSGREADACIGGYSVAEERAPRWGCHGDCGIRVECHITGNNIGLAISKRMDERHLIESGRSLGRTRSKLRCGKLRAHKALGMRNLLQWQAGGTLRQSLSKHHTCSKRSKAQ